MGLTLYPYQENTVNELRDDKHIAILGVGLGKGPISMVWAARRLKQTGKRKLLIISTKSKVSTNDFEGEMDNFVSPAYRASLSSFEKTSWHSLHKWFEAHRQNVNDYVIVADELRRIAGTTTRMGRVFLTMVRTNHDWAGFTATPGDTWLNFCAYFIATGFIRNKTQFMRDHCIIQTFKGFPEVVGYRGEDKLKAMWQRISYAPDTSEIEAQIPSKLSKTIHFKLPKDYKQTLKDRLDKDGNFIESAPALAHYLRQLCFTKEKQAWLRDFLTDLGEGCVIFYHYTSTADTIEQIATKALPKGAKVWRIDGRHHDIPTKDQFGPHDIVLAQWQSGGEGLNLQFLSVWVAVELTYTYSQFNQAVGRIRRIGQTHAMRFFGLVVDDSIEADIVKCLQRKEDFSVKVWGLGQGYGVE